MANSWGLVVKQDSRARRASQAGLDSDPVARLKAITNDLEGHIVVMAGLPCGKDLICPICRRMAYRSGSDINYRRMKISLGKLPNNLVVLCERLDHNQNDRNALAKAVTKATGKSLFPSPSPSELRERLLAKMERMRKLQAYAKLLPLAKAVIEHLGETAISGRERNGDILRSKKQWMAALKSRSSSQTDTAIAKAVASGLITRERTAAPTLEGGRPSFRYGLKCLPTDVTCARAKPRAKPQKVGLNPPDSPGNVEGKMESYADVGDYPP